jgi:hypothetical protein
MPGSGHGRIVAGPGRAAKRPAGVVKPFSPAELVARVRFTLPRA